MNLTRLSIADDLVLALGGPQLQDIGGQATYMHDGRAASLEEAIRLHGEESAASRNGFSALLENDRTALIAFLESL